MYETEQINGRVYVKLKKNPRKYVCEEREREVLICCFVILRKNVNTRGRSDATCGGGGECMCRIYIKEREREREREREIKAKLSNCDENSRGQLSL